MSKTPTFIDTHCHIHDDSFFNEDNDLETIIADAHRAGVKKMICVGTDVISSAKAIACSEKYGSLYASVALHPHEAGKKSLEVLERELSELREHVQKKPKKLIAIGECGLDYFYHSDKEVKDKQKQLLKMHLDLAQEHNLPLIFHVREAFDDFFKIIEDYPQLPGVLHSFTDTPENMKKAVNGGLYIGLNGIMTFTSDESQLQAAKEVPITHLLLETDAPFLTPKPFRGKMCKPQHVVDTARFLSVLRQESMQQLSEATTANANLLFTIK